MNNGNKAVFWRCTIKIILLGGAITAGVMGFGQCEREEGGGVATATCSAEVLRGVEGRLLVVHHHGSDAAVDKEIDGLLVAFAAEPGPRKWSWICLAPSDFGESPSFLSFHNGPVTLAEFRGPWDREALRASVERMAAEYRRGQADDRTPVGGIGRRGKAGGNPLVADR